MFVSTKYEIASDLLISYRVSDCVGQNKRRQESRNEQDHTATRVTTPLEVASPFSRDWETCLPHI